MSSLLEIEGLSVEFRMTDGVIRAVNDVSFDVRAARWSPWSASPAAASR